MKTSSIAAGAVLLLLGAVACSGGGAGITSAPFQNAPAVPAGGTVARAEPTSQRAITPSPYSSTTVIAVNSGGRAAGDGWVGDTDYYNNQWTGTASVSNTIDTSHVANPAPQAVYQNQRYGTDFTYTIPNLARNVSYALRLHFAESYFHSSGQRLFNVLVNGSRVLTNFDIFAAAGGQNIAIAESFTATSNGNGQIVVQLLATQNYATIAGIQISTGSGGPSPTPTPTSKPGGDTMPWVYSELWSASSPFKTTVAALKAAGAAVQPHSDMDALWSQGIAGNPTAATIPIYVASSSDPLFTVTCIDYGGNCNAKNMQVHLPSYAVPQQSSDGHLTVIDQYAPRGSVELDCWQTSINYPNLRCSWAGAFTPGTSGMTTTGSSGIHGGMAVSTVFTTAQEIVNGHIDHALGMNVTCLNNVNVYPAWIPSGTDGSCGGGSSPHYGSLVHLLWSPSQIAQSAYSAPCKTVLTALAVYGAYLDDTGNNGMQINTQNELSYTANQGTRGIDPWPGIQSKLNAAGDGTGDVWYSCLNRLASSDFEMLQVAQP